MAQTSLIIGDTNWAVKEDSLLGYNVIQNNYLPIPIDCVRATTATRVNDQGLIEIVPRNLLLYSEQFDNANWGKINATVTTNTTTAPNGTLTADKLIATAVNGTHLVLQIGAGAVLGQNLTLSVYAKSAGLTRLQFVNNGGGSGISSYDLTTGIATLSSGVSATMQDVGNGWYRCVLTFAPSATGNFNIQIRLLDSSGNSTFTGNDVDGIFAWGAQIDNGSVATEYFPTTDRLDIPRIDYSTGTASLLVEPQRTNVLLRSEEFDNASWAKSSVGSGVNPVVTANFAISPDGTQDADRIVFNTPLSTDISQITQAISLTGSSTGSVYLKAEASGDVGKVIAIRFNSAGYTLVTLTNSWQRFSVTATALSSFDIALRPAIGTSTGSVSVLAWGAQLEAGSYATSYIPTIASTVTRNTDVISRTGISSLIGQAEGTIFLEADIQKRNETDFYIGISNGYSLGEAIYFNQPSSGNLNVLFRSAGLAQTINILSANWNAGNNKIAIAYSSTLGEVFINGVSKGTVALTAIPTCNQIALGSRTDSPGGLIGAGPYKQAILFKTRLSNTELAQLTTI